MKLEADEGSWVSLSFFLYLKENAACRLALNFKTDWFFVLPFPLGSIRTRKRQRDKIGEIQSSLAFISTVSADPLHLSNPEENPMILSVQFNRSFVSLSISTSLYSYPKLMYPSSHLFSPLPLVLQSRAGLCVQTLCAHLEWSSV